MNPAAPVRRIDIMLPAIGGEFNPEPVGSGNLPYLFVVPPTRAFVGQERASAAGRHVPAGTLGAAVERSATTSARSRSRGFPSTGCGPPSNHKSRPPTGKRVGWPRHG